MFQNEFINRVLRGDCTAVLPKLPAESCDLALTDPPYVVGYRSRDGRSLAGDNTTAWIEPAFRAIFRVLKPQSFCVSFYSWNHADTFMAAWRRAGFRPVGHLVFIKPYSSSAGFLRYQHESAYLLAKGQPRRQRFPLKDVLRFDYTGNQLHPTEKPVSALRPLIGAFSRRGDLVLDPFCGSGSTLAAARQLGRHYLGIELTGRYWQIACRRLQG
jgi:site-specific DNA-methyltransferase (adenine-specific)